MDNNIGKSINKLLSYIETNNYRGYDPYDALKSPFFKLPFFKSSKLLRFGTQQFVKRFPINVRPLLLVSKGYNPVTLGLSIQAYAYLYRVEPEFKEEYNQKINFLIKELINLIPDGYSGACWGYDFDWEARNVKIPAYQPTVVATGIITNALFKAYEITGNEEAAELVKSAAKFVIKDLNRTYKEDTFCFSYSPFDKQQVFNASMKGARLLAQAYYLEKNKDYKNLASQAVSFVATYQNENGSWPYSLAKAGNRIDNYHTGYVLDCFDEYQKLTKDSDYSQNIIKGYKFYKQHFIDYDGAPKFYYNKKYPVDCTAAAQTILTTVRFGDVDIAKKVAEYIIKTMQKPNGSFEFRKFKYYTISTSFMRWSDAWMFAALSYLKKYLS